jgi:alpha-glucoside transport system ATP-binding protein
MAEVTLRKVVKRYDEVEAVRGIDLDIADQEFVVLVGPSGCGKSTTLRMIAGLEDITDGDIMIGGDVVNDVPPKDRDIAMVFQNYALYPHMTVAENMSFGLRLKRYPKAEIKSRVTEAARMLDITDLIDRKPKQLSGGQRQRVAMGRAIVRNPKVFLFDEPLSNLDAALRVATRIEIAKLKESMPNTTMIYVTHDQVEAMTLADRIVVLKDGHIEQVGTPMDLYKKPGNLFVAQFIGSPAMNILPATIDKTGNPTVVSHVGGRKATVPISTPASAKGAAVSFGVRPEDLIIATGADYLFEGTVDYVEQLGEVQLVYVDIGRADLPLVTKLPGNVEVKRGAKLRLTADAGDLHIFDADGHSFSLKPVEVKAA